MTRGVSTVALSVWLDMLYVIGMRMDVLVMN